MVMTGPFAGTRGWHLHCYNSIIGNALEIMAPSTFTYAQNDGEDQIEVVSDSVNDTTQTVTVYGIDNAGKKISEKFELNGTTVDLSVSTWRYVENAWMDTEAAGTVTVQDEDNNSIAEIEIGSLNTGIAQHFNGESQSYITYFAAGLYDTTKDCMFELRWYPDDADCLDATDGFEVLDRIFMPVEVGNAPPATDPHTVLGPLPKGGWIVVYAIADAASAKGFCTVKGFDVEVPA